MDALDSLLADSKPDANFVAPDQLGTIAPPTRSHPQGKQPDALDALLATPAPAPEPSLGDVLSNIGDSIVEGVKGAPAEVANWMEAVAPLGQPKSSTPEYGSGPGALVDNPLTRGLAQSADTGAAGLNELLGRVFVAPVDYFRPGTLEAYRNTMVTPAVQAEQAQAAPADAPLAERALQGLSSLAGQVSIAGATGGGTTEARTGTQAAAEAPALATTIADALKSPQARLAGTLGSEAGGAQVAGQEAAGQPVSNAKAASIVAANTAANLIPLGHGLPLAARIPAGVGAGVGGNTLVNAANGQPLFEGALPAGTLGAILGVIGAHGEPSSSKAGEVQPLADRVAQMRAELKAHGLTDAQIDAILNPAPEAATRALPAPVVNVDSAGHAATAAQADAAQRAAQARAQETGLTPDVVRAQAARTVASAPGPAPREPLGLPPPVVAVDSSGTARTSSDFMQQLREALAAAQRNRELGLTPDVQRAQAARLAPELARQAQERANPSPSTIDAMLAEVEGRTPAPQGAQVPEPGVPEPAQEKVAAYFSNLPREIGWEQRGGGIIRGQGSGLSEGDHAMAEDRSGPVIGRMPWIPKIGGDGQPSSFWRMRPDKALTEAQAHEAFRKIDAGEPLRPIEQRFIDYARQTAHEYAQAEAEDTARFEAEQNEADDIERQRAIEELRNENARFATADHGEAFTVAQWARRAREAGMSLDEVLAALGEGDNGARISNLAKAIADKENARGTDTQPDGLGREGGVPPDQQGQAAAVHAGESAAGEEGAGGAEPSSAEAAAGQVRFSRPGTPPSGDLFGAPTSADRLRAAQEAKDAQRNGKTGGREPTGDGGLFDGERPEQARIAEPKQPDQLFRRPAPPVTHTPEQVRATLRKSPLGRAFGKLEEAGALRIESHPDQDWSGYWDGDKAVLNAARAGEEGWLGTAMHELGGHGSLHDMLGDEGFARALSDIRSLADAKGPAGDIVRRAMRRVESADTPARHRDEELLAYTISEAVREGKAWKSGALNSALVRIFNRIRAWMKTSTIGKLLAKHGVDWKLNPDDIAALAESGIRRMAREASAPAHEPMAEPLFHRGNDGERDLIAQHNTTAEKLAHADRMGGLAVPSIGITRAGHPLQDFGDISLIGDKELVNPHSGAKVFGADAYTPRYPEVRFKTDATVAKNVARIIGKKVGERLEVEFAGSAEDLTHQPAFKRYAEAQLGDGYGYHQARALAEQVLREAGAKEVLFKGFTNMGNRRYAPHTLENVVKELKRNLRGGEGFDYGPGSIRAKYTPQFRSIEAIRDAKDKIVAKEDFEKLKEEVNSDFFAVSNELAPYHAIGNDFRFTDTVTQTMQDAARMGIPRALRENGFHDVPQEAQAKLGEFLTHLRNMPTHYFEAILPRAVGIHEFRSAVIPKDTTAATRDLLQRHGLNVHEYDKSVEGDQARAVREAAQNDGLMFSEGGHDPTETPAFRRWFGDSKVVDAQGKPLTVYHGTADGFYAFDNARLGEATAHMTAPLGHFFAEDQGKAQRYAENASRGVPADERVVDAYLSIQRPKEMSLDDFMQIDSQDEARALKATLQREGYDGIHLQDAGQWIAFKPEQIKSASENVGSFDATNPDIRYSRRTPEDRAEEMGNGASGPAAATGVKNAQTKAERAARGLDELDVEGRRSFGTVWDNAEAKLRDDPNAGHALAQHIAEHPRALSAEETAVLTQDRARISVERRRAAEDVNKAVQSGDVSGEAIARAKLDLANEQMETSDKAARASGYEQGLGLAIRAQMQALDYSLESMEARLAAAKGTPLDETDLQRLKELHEQMQAKEAELAGRAEAKRARQKETKAQLQEQLRLFKDQLNEAESRRDTVRQKQLHKDIAELARRIVQGDYSKTVRTPIQYNEETNRLLAQRNFLRKKFDRLAAQAEYQNKSKAQKALSTFLALRRAIILAGFSTLFKLSAAASYRIGLSPIEHGIQGGLGKLPGLRGVAAKAPLEGRFSPRAEGRALKETFSRQTLRDMRDKFVHGEDMNDLLYGKNKVSLHARLDMVGHIHAALKNPAERNAFARAQSMGTEFETRRAMDAGMTPEQVVAHLEDPLTQGTINLRAYAESQRAVFKNKNVMVKGFNALKRTIPQIAPILDYVFPIVNVPSNYLGEALSYAGGLAKAAKALRDAGGVKNMTADQADYIMRALGKQSVGVALGAIGWLFYKQIGSFYQSGDNKRKNIPKEGTAFGVPKLALDTPAATMLTVGANLHRIAQGIHNKDGSIRKGTGTPGNAVLNTAQGLWDEIPFVREPQYLAEDFRDTDSLKQAAGKEIAHNFIPPESRRLAAYLDHDTPRKPKGFTDEVKMVIPGLREDVPRRH